MQARVDAPGLVPVSAGAAPMSKSEQDLLRRLIAGMILILTLGYAIGSGPFKTDTRTDVKLVLSFGWQNAVLFAQMVVNVVSVTAAAALMYPAMASDNGIPLWPWIAPAYFTGVLPLLAYITAWQPKPRMRLPPTASQMRNSMVLTVSESRALAVALASLAGLALLVAQASNQDTWQVYRDLSSSSRLMHLAQANVVAMQGLLGLLMFWDGHVRGWKLRFYVVPLLAVLPVLGAPMYLAIRPCGKAGRRRAATS